MVSGSKGIRDRRSIAIGLAILGLIVIATLFANQLAPNDPAEANLRKRLSPPSMEYPFGTDQLGRCIFSRVLFGARISLGIGLVVVALSAIFGLLFGGAAGYYGGVLDEALMRIVDGFLAVPSMFLALAVVGFLGPGIANIVLALVVVEWTSYARVARGEMLSLKEKEFLEAARALGAGDIYIFIHHLLPNILAPILVVATLGIGYAILAAAGLSFLGLGMQPDVPEWGSMLNDGRLYLRTAPHLMIFPGLAITITVLAINLVGEGIREMLDPRRKSGMKDERV
jgi:peptide/nickel transport system permease protein